MSLKPARRHVDSTIDCFMNHTAERGGVVCYDTVGSGTAMDSASQTVHYKTSPSGGQPVGLLMCDVVNLDLTRQHLNQYQEEVQVGGKVTIWTKGTVTTNYLVSGITVTAGQVARVGAQGQLTNTGPGEVVGRFDTAKDEDGFARVTINLP
jgi:hypothetical protein